MSQLMSVSEGEQGLTSLHILKWVEIIFMQAFFGDIRLQEPLSFAFWRLRKGRRGMLYTDVSTVRLA